MNQHISLNQRTIRLGAATLTSLCLLACASSPSTSSAIEPKATAMPSAGISQASLRGVYELVHSTANNAIYVAGMGERFGDGKGGFIYQLDADTLVL